MAAHKYWTACLAHYISPAAAGLVYPYPMELSELQLYNGATRLGATITPTCVLAPTTGTLAALRDDLTTVGVYWADITTFAQNIVRLNWEFPAAVEVDGVLIGHRTTAVRAVGNVMMVGSDSLTAPFMRTIRGTGNIRWVSAAKTAVIPLSDGEVRSATSDWISGVKDWGDQGGRGLITDTVKTKGVSANIPTHCKVRLLRDVDSKVIRETWTHPVTGVYTFDNFDEHHTYTVLAIHPLGSFRAVIADRLTPGLMP
jgi:hypothetical protein